MIDDFSIDMFDEFEGQFQLNDNMSELKDMLSTVNGSEFSREIDPLLTFSNKEIENGEELGVQESTHPSVLPFGNNSDNSIQNACDSDCQMHEISFLGHSKSEIDRHISQAEHDIRDAESSMRHHKYIADSKARMGESHEYEDYQYKQALRRLEHAKSELNKWRHMHPDDK